jgi:phage-related protein
MAITSAINDLFASIYELLASVFNTVYTIIHSIFSAVLGFVQGFFNLIGDVVSGLVDVTGGVGKFVASNAAILAVGALGAFAYVRYTAQGKQVANKKTQ